MVISHQATAVALNPKTGATSSIQATRRGERSHVTTSAGKTKPTRITLNDFMTGLLAGLAHEHVKVISIDGAPFYKAVVDVFNELERRVEDDDTLKLRFWITQDETHQDSPDVRDGITSAVQRRLVSLDNPTYQRMRLKISAEESNDYLDDVPGGKDLYVSLASRFKSAYPAYA